MGTLVTTRSLARAQPEPSSRGARLISTQNTRLHLSSAKRYNPSSRNKANSGDQGQLTKLYQASLQGVLLIEPKVFEVDRGFFLESYTEI
jgi:hypothetical protein